jgi:shikimate kinase
MDTAALLQGTSIYLIGMMGAGKTTIGQLLATSLNYGYFDTDGLIEQATQQPVPQIFAESGEAIFRELETRTLEALAPMLRCTIATGGGIVLKPENWGYLRHGVIVWLDVPIEVLQARLASDTTRPLLQEGNLADRLQQLDAARRSLYAQADIHVTISATETPETIRDRVLVAIGQACQAKAAADAAIQRANQTQPYRLN